MKQTQSIEYLPILTRGKHRNPRQGACFMEFASYLAGERWSDDPACTHGLLASLARLVNDRMSDDVRQTLLPLVPEVIGLTSKDPRVDVVIALRAATTALPVVSEERQRVMALAVANCERQLAELEERPDAPMSARSRRALASAPAAAEWLERQRKEVRTSRRVFRRQTAPAIVRYAVDGIARACVGDPDRVLRELLAEAIGDTRLYCTADEATHTIERPVPPPRPTASPTPLPSADHAR
jgi:hypothetical protein